MGFSKIPIVEIVWVHLKKRRAGSSVPVEWAVTVGELRSFFDPLVGIEDDVGDSVSD